MGVMNKIMDFLGLYEEERVEEEVHDEQHTSSKRKNNVVSLQQVKTNSKLVLLEPYSYDEAQDIADQLRNRRPVILNLQRMKPDHALRMIDFLSGTVYALNGEIQKISSNTFLCTPDNVEIQGSITDLLPEETMAKQR